MRLQRSLKALLLTGLAVGMLANVTVMVSFGVTPGNLLAILGCALTFAWIAVYR